MRPQIKIIFILFCFHSNLYAQSANERYHVYLSQANDCLVKSDFDCATINCQNAQNTAKNYGFSSHEADELLVKVKNVKEGAAQQKNVLSEKDKPPKNENNKSLEIRSSRGVSRIHHTSLNNKILSFPNSYPFLKNITKEKLSANINDLLEKVKFQTPKKSDDGTLFAKYNDRLYGINYQNEDKFLYDSTSKIVNKSKNIDDQTLSLHLRFVEFYGWNLLEESARDSSRINLFIEIVQKTIKLISNHSINSALTYFGIASFENLLSKYYGNIKDSLNSLKFNMRALHYSELSVEANSSNTYYLECLFALLRNMQYNPESLLSANEKSAFISLSGKVADYMANLKNDPNKAIIASAKYDYTSDAYYRLINKMQYNFAIDTLTQCINSIVKYRKSDINYKRYGPLLLAGLYNKLCEIYNYYEKDSIKYNIYSKNAVNNLILFLGSKISSQSVLDKLKGIYQGVTSNMDLAFNDNEIISNYRSIISAIETSDNDYVNSRYLYYVYTISNSSLGQEFLLLKSKDDTTMSIPYFVNALNAFQQTGFLKFYNYYSEDFTEFCSIFTKTISIYVGENNFIMATKIYNEMMKTFIPIYKKYPFDFYLGNTISNSSSLYGQFSFERGKYNEAIPALNFASYNGIKKSTEVLIKIYNSEGFKDREKLDSLIKRNSYQAYGMKRYSIPVQCGSVKQSFHIYITDRAKDYPYKGIEDQAIWLSEARGCEISDLIVSSFTKLQKIAWDNNVSFENLCAYALAPDTSKILQKYTTIKNQIDSQKNVTAKESLYENLYNLYEQDIQKDTINKDIIIKDAIKSYEEYTSFLEKNNFNNKAIDIYKRLIELGQIYLVANPDDSSQIKQNIANNYNSLGWNCILVKKFDSLIYIFNKSLDYDSNYVYPKENMAHAYLFNNQFKKAKELYLKYKDLPFDETNGFPTYKSAFLDDFNQFKQRGIKNDHIDEIVRLLSQ